MASLPLFMTCPKGLEALLAEELGSLGLGVGRQTVAGVSVAADLAGAYRACLWSRLANRVLLVLSEAPCADPQALYEQMMAVDWSAHLDPDATFAIDVSGHHPAFRDTRFAAQKAKDAIADQFTRRLGRRPDVDLHDPVLRINLRLGERQTTVAIDLSGESLHRRGYRLAGAAAPLKENLAAALLLRADWPGLAARGGALLDPMCGSGTLLIEGALMAMGIAPGVMRARWGFDGWLGHQADVWRELLAEASVGRSRALQRQWPEIRGYDHHPAAVQAAEDNIQRAGLEAVVRVSRKPVEQFAPPTHRDIAGGLVITNPPYGERLGEEAELGELYASLGQRLRSEFEGWQAAVFTGNVNLAKRLGIRARKQYKLFNGPLPASLLLFDVTEAWFMRGASPDAGVAPAPLSVGAQMLANRLRKNQRRLKPWLAKDLSDAYRLYDADLPEYAVAIDCYGEWVHVAEYAPPATIDPAAAEERLREVLAAVTAVLGVAADKLVLKRRERQRGQRQYQRQAASREWFVVREGQAKVWVNLRDYLDTGLFLDHRPVRLDIARRARGMRFLNLYCYTAVASVQAAVGGASRTVSVDLSNTYLEWAARNMTLNKLDLSKNRLERADCEQWLQDNKETFDLILLDPPTFSNSKRTEQTLDIQRDHMKLLELAMARLSSEGVLIFSNNRRRFRLDPGASERWQVEDRTAWSHDMDFPRSPPIHQCWYIRHA
ncbi:MAG TPA: bifunctional 23S rRNA (guanine(2069)-N(7))-methyltransferase RlmK/23S rRNA (guanine(2445)-N(2))-methyltransferase RlmL [Spongiibacteraceae bacterium]|nr:bifunctional 23S rRNA (guanine(2069)-N(7))-methyltransferase RlmK/23S rRNA (guanine(2445)-N(2))-methyltransferase RlmL [Spongiibacteraceae bacterium]